MPKWGLTEEQRRSRPWGIDERWLLPGKTITDPIHGDIYVNALEQRLIDSPPMQRLRRVRQLGTTHLVYPGATHTRLSHSLGALRAAQDLLDAVIDNRTRPRPADDFFSEWSNVVGVHGAAISEFDAELAKVTVLVRLGALLHDVNHVPFGHTIEDDLELLVSHDHNHDRLKLIWGQFHSDVRGVLAEADPKLTAQLTMLIVSKDENGDAWPAEGFEYPFVADIVGNTICADLIDYLERDHLYTGLPIALGDRFKDEFYVSPSSEVHFPKKMVIRVTREGHERHDVITELLKYLRYRYELSERALAHHAKLAADAMIGKLLEMRADWLYWYEANKREPAAGAKFAKDVGALREEIAAIGGTDLDTQIRQAAAQTLEADFLSYGDDGLLERMRDWGSAPEASGDGRRQAVGRLAEDVLNRRLFKRAGRADARHDLALAGRIYARFGKRDPRRLLEEATAQWAGLEHRWSVVIWLPSPRMRLKIAEVLVDHAGRINHLDRLVRERAEDIYTAHQNLWGISVYLNDDVDAEAERRVLAYLGSRLGVQFLDKLGQPAPTIDELVIEALEAEFESLGEENIVRISEGLRRNVVPAHGGHDGSFVDLIDRARVLAVEVMGGKPADGGGQGLEETGEA